MTDELTEQVLAAEQDERRRIALFLHDGPVQSLAGVALMLDAATSFLERGATDQAHEVLEKALARTRVTIGELRDLSFNLEPVVLRDHGFSMAVNELVEDKGSEHGMTIEIDVTAAEALGERRLRVITHEVLPNMNAPLLAEAGLRLTYSIALVAAVGFLGFATNPGAADWGVMINENRLALLLQPWGVLAPVIVIAIFTVGTNLMADGIAQVAQRGDS